MCMPCAHSARAAGSATQCRQQFKNGKSAQAVAELLVDIALKRYTTDNVAVVVADLRGKDAWTAKPAKPARKGGLLTQLFGGNGKKA